MKNSSKKIIATVYYYYLFSLSYRNMSETLKGRGMSFHRTIIMR